MSPIVHAYTIELRHDGGTIKIHTSATTPISAVKLVRDAGGAPPSAVLRVWEWPECDYCNRSATRYDRDSGDPLCWEHAVEHNETATEARRATGELGVTRLSQVDRALWAD